MNQNQKFTLKLNWKIVISSLLFIVFVIWMIWGNTTIQISHVTVENEHLPEQFDGYKIAHISDLHNKRWGQMLLQLLQEEQPDMIAITGDLIDSQKTDLYTALEFVDQAEKIAPVYYVTGNQEAVSNQYSLLEKGLRDRAIVFLEDEITLLENEASISLLGLHDPLFMIDRYPQIELPNKIDDKLHELTVADNNFKILLSHRPELFDLYVKYDIDLVLSGHAHGGQFRLPFIGGLYAPDQGFFPKYTTGVYQENNTSMVVSRGLGNSVIPIRFNNRPELVFVKLNHKK